MLHTTQYTFQRVFRVYRDRASYDDIFNTLEQTNGKITGRFILQFFYYRFFYSFVLHRLFNTGFALKVFYFRYFLVQVFIKGFLLQVFYCSFLLQVFLLQVFITGFLLQVFYYRSFITGLSLQVFFYMFFITSFFITGYLVQLDLLHCDKSIWRPGNIPCYSWKHYQLQQRNIFPAQIPAI